MEIKCSCLRMESMGIPCEHIVGVMVYLNMVEIPSYLVLDRWTKNVKDSISCSKLVQGTSWDSMTICRYKALNQRFRDVNGLGCKSVEDYLDTMDVLNAHFERLKIKHDIQFEEVSNDANRKERFVQNPKVAKTKGHGGGRGTSRRQTKRGRRSVHCGFCGNVGHNKANCEVRRKVNGVDDEDETNNSVTDEDLYSKDDE
ncbi:protein FAR1-RELATED SEQUENCE 3-like [Trifolium pratense]|uniref:protein FAR1-RELATED SEQUENCE 3-like n=1 Tax=Trifolium pratense TaxID=57577 RepID=UPI001E693C10|nr:protein FAR1-RELATED SEQUENCE 3-like [Trifolium pratense]